MVLVAPGVARREEPHELDMCGAVMNPVNVTTAEYATGKPVNSISVCLEQHS